MEQETTTWYYYYYFNSPNETYQDMYPDELVMTVDQFTEFIIVSIFYGLVFMLGTAGNTLVIFCIAKYKRMQSITNQLLLSLACADLLLTIVCVPIKFAELFSYGWSFGEFLCKATHYTQTWSMVTSVMTLTVISIERYYAISQPLKAKYLCTSHHARAVILSIWFASCLLSLPSIFVQSHYAVGLHVQVFWCDKQWYEKGTLVAVSYEIYMLVLLFLVPVFIMIPAYCGVCAELWEVTQPDLRSSPSRRMVKKRLDSEDNETPTKDMKDGEKPMGKSHSRENQIRKQVLKMLVTVVAIFILSWGPHLCYNLALATGAIKPYLPMRYPYAKQLNEAFALLAYANSCVNPIVYGFMSKYFRKSFKQALFACCASDVSLKSYVNSPLVMRERSSVKRNSRITDRSKRGTISTGADSTLSRSPPVSPVSTYPRIVAV